MTRFLTLTVNPALDKSTTVGAIVPDKKLRCSNPKVEAGGGGVNVSRAMKQLGCESVAMYLAGGYTGDYYTSLLKSAGITTDVIPISGDTRENFIVVDSTTNQQYRFGMEGPEIGEREWKSCLQKIEETSFEYLVASGSLAPGMPTSFFKELAKIVNRKGSRLVIDTSGDALKDAVDEGVYLIKPNLGELSSLYGVDELNDEDAAAAARELIAKKYCEVIVVSMGASGALLVTAGEVYKVHPPAVKRKSTVGAGDSMVAGMLVGISRGLDWNDVLRYGVAAGTAATIRPGTALCSKEDTDRLFRQIQQKG